MLESSKEVNDGAILDVNNHSFSSRPYGQTGQTDTHDAEIIPCKTTNENVSTKRKIRSNVYRTAALYSTFIIMGISSPLLGTTYIHLEKLFHVTSQTVSLAMVTSSGGYLLGAVACGILYDRINPETLFAAFNLIGVASSFVVGYAQNFYVFMTAMVFHEIAFGFDDAAGQSYCVGIWKDHKLKKPLLQGLHAFWSLGGFFGPMIIKIFLCELDTSNIEHSSWNISDGNVLHNSTNLDGCSGTGGSIDTTRYAFIVLGIVALIANLPFVILCIRGFIHNRKQKRLHIKMENNIHEMETIKELVKQPSDTEVGELGHKNSTTFKVIHMIFIFVFTMFNIYTELLPILFLVSFAFKHLHWSVMNSSLLLSVYYGAHFAGRVVGVLSSVWISPIKMLSFNLVITVVAHLLMLLVNEWPDVAWISAVIAGFGVSTTFPTNVLWISESTVVTGKLGATMIIGMCCCSMSSPYIVATVTSSLGQMWYVYILILAAIIHVVVFIFEACFVCRCSS